MHYIVCIMIWYLPFPAAEYHCPLAVTKLYCSLMTGEWEVTWPGDRAASASVDHWVSGLTYPRDSRAIPTREHIYPRLQPPQWRHYAAWTKAGRRPVLHLPPETLPRPRMICIYIFTYLISFPSVPRHSWVTGRTSLIISYILITVRIFKYRNNNATTKIITY